MKIWHALIMLTIATGAIMAISSVMNNLERTQGFGYINTTLLTKYDKSQDITTIAGSAKEDMEQPAGQDTTDLSSFWGRIGSTYKGLTSAASTYDNILNTALRDTGIGSAGIIYTVIGTIITLFFAWKIIEFLRG